jgi:hypothetical protein
MIHGPWMAPENNELTGRSQGIGILRDERKANEQNSVLIEITLSDCRKIPML